MPHVLRGISFLEVFTNILGDLSVTLEYIYSWMPRRPRDLPDPLLLGRLKAIMETDTASVSSLISSMQG